MSSIAITGGATGTGVFSLVAPSTSTNRTINLPDSNGTILTTATAGVPVNGPAFSANSNATQAISQSAWTKVVYGNEIFDTNNNFASNRFTPTVAGYYQVNATINFGGGTYPIDSRSAIYKNGSVYANGSAYISAAITNGAIHTASCLIYMNGSTDYLEIYAYTGSSGTTLYGDSSNTLFNGCLVRSAV